MLLKDLLTCMDDMCSQLFYFYSYVSVGELLAFVIGWNMLLEYAIGAAAVSKGWSQYMDSLVNGAIQR